MHVGKLKVDSGFIAEGNDTKNVSLIEGMNDGVDGMFDEVEPTESIRLSGLALSGLAIHGAWDVKDANDGDSIPFSFEFWRSDFDIGHEIASVESGDGLESEIFVVHEMRWFVIDYKWFIKDLKREKSFW